MPPAPQRQQDSPGRPGAAQIAASKFIIFDNFTKMSTQNPRQALDEKELAWLENLQPIGKNNLSAVPAAAAAIATIVGEQINQMFFATIGAIDFVIAFTVDGGGYAINAATGAVTQFATIGTFSNPDCTTWAGQRLLIQDPTSGYCTWDTNTFVKQGGVSPNIRVTAGGSLYVSAPAVAITGGSGSGATAHSVIAGGAVVAVVLDNPGVNYQAGDTLTVGFSGGGGSSAAATAIVWPFTVKGTTLAVFAGRVWMGAGRVLAYTGTAGFDDVNPANAAGTSTINDADLTHAIYCLRNFNNYLFILGDNSVKQIGAITVSGSTTLFTILTLSSDQGTTFKNTVASYNRLVLFANRVGVFAIFGASVQKVSDDLDGIFQLIDFTQVPMGGLNDLRNLHCYLLLVRYRDPVAGTRSIICIFMNNKWFVVSQGNALTALTTAALASSTEFETFASSGADVTQLLQDSTTAVPITLKTALTHHGNLIQRKKALRAGFAATVAGGGVVTMAVESENGSLPYALSAAPAIIWVNNLSQPVQFQNNALQNVNFTGNGFVFPSCQADASGKFLGVTLTATLANFAVNAVAIEYQETVPWL